MEVLCACSLHHLQQVGSWAIWPVLLIAGRWRFYVPVVYIISSRLGAGLFDLSFWLREDGGLCAWSQHQSQQVGCEAIFYLSSLQLLDNPTFWPFHFITGIWRLYLQSTSTLVSRLAARPFDLSTWWRECGSLPGVHLNSASLQLGLLTSPYRCRKVEVLPAVNLNCNLSTIGSSDLSIWLREHGGLTCSQSPRQLVGNWAFWPRHLTGEMWKSVWIASHISLKLKYNNTFHCVIAYQ
jgi:hypothetical protein